MADTDLKAGAEARRARQPYTANPHTEFGPMMDWATGWREADEAIIKERIKAFNRTYEANAARRGQYDPD